MALSSCHPDHIHIKVNTEIDCCKELLDVLKVVVLLQLHEVMQSQLLGDPKHLMIVGVRPHSLNAQWFHGTHLLGECKIHLLEDASLLSSPKELQLRCLIFIVHHIFPQSLIF